MARTLTPGVDFTVDTAGNYTFNASSVPPGTSVQVTYQGNVTIPSQSALGQIGLSFAPGNVGQNVWGYLQSAYPSQAIAYSGLCYVYSSAYDLGDTAEVANHSFEVSTAWELNPAAGYYDADPALVIGDMLTNGRYGANFPSSRVGSLAAISQYARAQFLVMSPAMTAQRTAADWLQYFLQLANSDCTWSQGVLKFVPLGDIPCSSSLGNYTPNTTPVYDLTEDHFVQEGTGDAVQVTRKSSEDACNHVRVEYTNRHNQYNTEIAEAKDAADIDMRGIRTKATVEAHAICEPAAAGNLAVLTRNRELTVLNTYTFKLPWSFGLLEPLDLVTLTYSAKGLNRQPVRINEVDEEDNGTFTVIAEDCPIGLATAPQYGVQSGSGFSHNYAADPGFVTQPTFFEAPVELTTTGLEVYAAVSGQLGNWGGCSVWASLDGNTYQRLTKLWGGSRYGTLTALLNPADTSLNVLLAGKGGQMGSGSSSAASLSHTLLWVDGASYGGEYLSYQTATLTGPNAYTLSGALRGQYRSSVQAHGVNANFVRVDDAVAKSGPLDISYVGKTIYFKFTSFNVYGGAEQQLGDVPAYPYTVRGGLVALPPPDVTNLQIMGDLLRWDPIDLVQNPDVVGYQVLFQYGNNVDIPSAMVAHQGGYITTPEYHLTALPNGVVTYMVRAVDASGAYSPNAAVIVTDLGDAFIANVLLEYNQKTLGWPGTKTNCAVDGSNNLVATATDQFFQGGSSATFFEGASLPFFTGSFYGEMQYETPVFVLGAALRGSNMTVVETHQTPGTFFIEYRLTGNDPFFGPAHDPFFAGGSSAPFFGDGAVPYSPWPGQSLAQNTGYQFRVTVGQGLTPGKVLTFDIVVDAPDLVETINDVPISAGGTVIPYTQPFGAIYNVQATLQANLTGGRTVEINKTNPLAPVAFVYDASHNAIGGATVDFTLKGISQ